MYVDGRTVMDAKPNKNSGTGIRGVVLASLVLGGIAAGCKDEEPVRETPAGPAWASSMAAGERMYFFDNFQNGLPAWEPMAGDWDLSQKGSVTAFAPVRRGYAMAYAGNPNWSNYSVTAQVTIDDDRQGPVGLVGRGDSDHYYFELVLGRDPQGEKSWAIRQRLSHRWVTLATGPFEYTLGTSYVMRLTFQGLAIHGSISRDGGRSFDKMGAAQAAENSWQLGRFGVVTYGGAVRFDDVGVTGDVTIALVDAAHGWGPVSLLRDDTNTFATGKPSGGWYVTPIHVTLRPDGKVLVGGFSRKGVSGCSGSTQRENGMTWLLDPTVLDSAADNSTLLTTPINEQNLDPVHDVLYCAGHSPMADGRIFLAAGTRYTDPGGLPDSNPERGLRYSRIFNGTSISRVSANNGTTHFTLGGQSASYEDPGNVGDGGTVRGEKWYPTTLLMPDGKMLTFGGFHFSAGGPSSKPNNSFEMFDTAAWDANHDTYPYTVLTQHATGGLSGGLPPTRGYSNMFLLPKPVPAGSAGGAARSVAIYGGLGNVVLFNHEPGVFSPDTTRLFARPNALTVSPDVADTNRDNEMAEGGSGVLLSDGRIMVVNGGHTGDGSKRAYVYDPYNDNWLSPSGAPCTSASCSLDMGISRMYGQAVQLPDGTVMALNGYNGNPGGDGMPDPEAGNENDIDNPIGDVRRPVLVDPYANPMTAVGQTAWPEVTHRGYHSVSLLLKDGRILTGGGKDKSHATGCEKNELRIYTPPYLQGSPTRPVISGITELQTIPVGGANFTINYTGTLKSTRGVALVAMGSLTHAFDMGQRYVPLTVVSGGGATGSVVVRPPTNINIAQPGFYNLFVINSAGVPSVAKTIQLIPPPACVYNVNGTDQYIEAEGRSRGDGPFTQVSDVARSGGAYMQVTEGSGTHATVPDEGKVLWYDLNVTTGGSFYIWALANGPDTGSDTMWISVDGNADQQLTLPTPVNTWNWVKLNTTAISIPTGKHTIKVKVREDGALIDKLAFTTNSAFMPSGTANPALTCNGPTPPPAPTGLAASPGDAQVLLMWNPVAGATSYTLKRGTASNGPFTNVPGAVNIPGTSFNDTGLTNGTTYYYVVLASNAAGPGPTSTPSVPAVPTAQSGGTWVGADVGAVGIAGSVMQAGGTFTVKGAGADITGTADAFYFVYQTLSGNGSISAHIASITGGDGVNVKAGVMMRDPGADGQGANDVNAFTMIKPTATQNKFQRRLTSPGSTTSTIAATAVPTWVRLTRTGNLLLSEQSLDGISWTTIGSDTVTMTNVRMGLAVTSHTISALTTVVFDNVVLTGVAPQGPPAPGNLVCTAANGQCQLSWNASTGADTYTVKRSTTMGTGHMELQAGIVDLSYTDTTVVNGTTYYYVVTATNTSGTSGNSNEQSCAPAAPPGQAPPPSATPGNGQVALSWSAVPGATSYSLQSSTTMGGPYDPIAGATNIMATSFTHTGLDNGTAYYYVLTASNVGGTGPASTEVTATPILPAPNPLAGTPGNRQASLSWPAVANATNYTVKVSSTLGGPYTALPVTITGTSHVDTNVINGFTYYYVVTANGTMESVNSNEVQVTPAIPAPGSFMATAGDGQVTLGWGSVVNASSYTVKRSLTSGGPYDNAVFPGLTMTSMVDTSVTNGTTYHYVVTAFDGAVESVNSSQASATPNPPMMGPAPPSNLSATITGGNSANLTWTDNSSNETGFLIERKVGTGSYSTLTTKAAGVTSHSDTPLTAGTYTYRVIATGTPNSAPSNEAVVVIRGSDADAHVRDGQATTNFGTAVALDVKFSFAAGATRHGYIRFSLADVAPTVTSAKIRVFANAVTTAKTIALWEVSNITWVESTINWNTRPTPLGNQITTQSISTTGAFREFDVTAYVQARKTAGATHVSFAFTNLTQSDDGPTVISTKENTTVANRPAVLISSK
jgi:fibronectin type 3 domain-containing protein